MRRQSFFMVVIVAAALALTAAGCSRRVLTSSVEVHRSDSGSVWRSASHTFTADTVFVDRWRDRLVYQSPDTFIDVQRVYLDRWHTVYRDLRDTLRDTCYIHTTDTIYSSTTTPTSKAVTLGIFLGTLLTCLLCLGGLLIVKKRL